MPEAAIRTPPRRPARRLLRISLSMMLVLIALVAAWLARVTNRARRQAEVVQQLEARGYRLQFDYEFSRGVPLSEAKPIATAGPPAPAWLRRLLGEEYFRKVVSVAIIDEIPEVRGPSEAPQGPRPDDEVISKLCDLGDLRSLWLSADRVGDAGLAHIHNLRGLEQLRVWECSSVTDKSLAHLEGLEHLEHVAFLGCPITAQGVAHLKSLPSLRDLSLTNFDMKPDAMVPLRDMRGLTNLSLAFRTLDDASLEPLGSLSQLEELHLFGSGVTDAGLVPIAQLQALETLDLRGFRMTDNGVSTLASLRNLVELTISPKETYLTDRSIESLHRLGSLKSLSLGSYLGKTRFTTQALIDLINALPHLQKLALEKEYLNPETTQELTETRPGLKFEQAR